MIIQHDPNCNPDDFVYKTDLRFGDRVGQELLAQVNRDLGYFERRVKYREAFDKDTIKSLIKQVGRDATRELIRRQNQITEKWPGETYISFKQYWCGDYFNQRILEETPSWLKELIPGEPYPILQVSDSESGELGLLPPHCGHKRISSLFCLLQGGGQETRWYTESEPFELVDIYHIPDLDKIKLAVSVVLEPNTWYVFNHRAWHSVHKFAYRGPSRVSFGLDFDSITAPDLVQLCKHHSG